MDSNWSLVICCVWLFLLLSVKGERCFNDTNCKSGEFCEMDKSGHFTVCMPCLSCKDYYREKFDRMSLCIRSLNDCGKCMPGYELGISGSGDDTNVFPHCFPTPPPMVDAGLLGNNTQYHSMHNLSSMNASGDENSTRVAKSAGVIAGGVAVGIVALAAIAFGVVYGFKYYKEKNRKIRESEKEERTVELQELHPQPTEVLTIDETKKPEMIEQKQNL